MDEPATLRTWSISELAQEFDTTLRTIRFYEDRGLITPQRRGQTRIFHPRDRVRLKLILRGKRLGFTLDEIATIVDMYDAAPGERGQLEYLIADIEQRRAALEQKQRDLADSLAELDELEARCRADLAALGPKPARPKPLSRKPLSRKRARPAGR